ncbi:hypothetical protein OR16_02525 [Cupriavidus basilensis OR16]|uniref:Uncharacterized protein n=1 Tax=Cupriavidus basilensis OR16 TaxID=1127483 RepID=H1RYZ1_9BURK|nr:hypothetical protein [Cupriavidus basilensis]EHP44522.1 hypothetical protein OR16_02525 [Cupriavidus basilensis OR16]
MPVGIDYQHGAVDLVRDDGEQRVIVAAGIVVAGPLHQQRAQGDVAQAGAGLRDMAKAKPAIRPQDPDGGQVLGALGVGIRQLLHERLHAHAKDLRTGCAIECLRSSVQEDHLVVRVQDEDGIGGLLERIAEQLMGVGYAERFVSVWHE